MSDSNTVSVDRAQYELHARSAQLLTQLLGDPRTAAQAEELVAQINPKAEFPLRATREAALKPVMTELEKERARIAALEAKLSAREEAETAAAAARQEAELLAKINDVKTKRGFSDEMMQRVMDRMRANNNPDVEAAAAWAAESVPKPAPATGNDFLPTTIDPYGSTSGDEAWAALHKNPDQWLTNELRAISRDSEFIRLGNQ